MSACGSQITALNILYTLAGGPLIFEALFPYTLELHFRILQNFKHPSSSSPLFKLIKHTSIFLQSRRWEIGRDLTSEIA
jgi:hypothetical protein